MFANPLSPSKTNPPNKVKPMLFRAERFQTKFYSYLNFLFNDEFTLHSIHRQTDKFFFFYSFNYSIKPVSNTGISEIKFGSSRPRLKMSESQ